MASPAVGIALRAALCRQDQCFVRSVPRWDSVFGLIFVADEKKNEDVTIVPGGTRVSLSLSRYRAR
jgi:hypothetical protein